MTEIRDGIRQGQADHHSTTVWHRAQRTTVKAFGRMSVEPPGLVTRTSHTRVPFGPDAAVCAMAMTRAEEWKAFLESEETSLPDGDLKAAVTAALAYLRGDLSTLQATLKQVAGDEIVRERLFFNRRG